jgi:hypothetical protein
LPVGSPGGRQIAVVIIIAIMRRKKDWGVRRPKHRLLEHWPVQSQVQKTDDDHTAEQLSRDSFMRSLLLQLRKRSFRIVSSITTTNMVAVRTSEESESRIVDCHLDVVGGPSTPHDPESDAGGSLSSWQGHPSR